jgi:hypothetical protein
MEDEDKKSEETEQRLALMLSNRREDTIAQGQKIITTWRFKRKRQFESASTNTTPAHKSLQGAKVPTFADDSTEQQSKLLAMELEWAQLKQTLDCRQNNPASSSLNKTCHNLVISDRDPHPRPTHETATRTTASARPSHVLNPAPHLHLHPHNHVQLPSTEASGSIKREININVDVDSVEETQGINAIRIFGTHFRRATQPASQVPPNPTHRSDSPENVPTDNSFDASSRGPSCLPCPSAILPVTSVMVAGAVHRVASKQQSLEALMQQTLRLVRPVVGSLNKTANLQSSNYAIMAANTSCRGVVSIPKSSVLKAEKNSSTGHHSPSTAHPQFAKPPNATGRRRSPLLTRPQDPAVRELKTASALANAYKQKAVHASHKFVVSLAFQ